MTLFIFYHKIDIKLFIKKENKLYWNRNNNIYMIAENANQVSLCISEIVSKYKILKKIIYIGYGFSINNSINFNDIILVKRSYNTMIDFTKFNYKIGLYPKEEDNKNISIENIKKITSKIPTLKIANVGSANIKLNNKYYFNYIKEKFSDKISVIDKITATVYFIGRKFNINYIVCFLFINSNKYDYLEISKEILQNFYKKINKMYSKDK